MQMKNLLTQIARVTGVVAVTLSMSLAAVTTANATEKKSCETKDKASYCASKQVDKSTAKRGDTLTYTLSLTNNGNVELNDVLFYDRIPTHTTYVAGSAVISLGSQSKAANENWVNTGINFGKVQPGQTAKLVFKVKVNSNVAHGTDIQNVGQFKTNELPEWLQCAVHTIVKVDAPKYSPSKTVDKTVAKRGDILTYTLTLKNDGNVTLNDVLFYDRIPTHTTYVANSAVITKGNQSKQPSENWVNTGINFGKVEVGQTVKLVFKVKVNNDVAHGTDIQNVGQFKTNELPNWVQCAVHTIVKVDHKPTPTPSSTPTPTPTPTPTGEVLGATPTPTVPPVAELPSTGPGLALVASLGGIVSALWGRKYFLSR